MRMVNLSSHVLSICYLFTALKQKGYVSGIWDAIEKVISRFPLVHTRSKTKSWNLADLTASEILRDYVHDRKTFITTLHRLDAFIARTNSTSPMLVEGH